MKVTEINVKNAVVRSHLPEADFVINPYIGCAHACKYCYAEFMKKLSEHDEPWGDFVDVKINSPELINRGLNGKVLLSSVTDPYQPIEKKYGLTRKILEKLLPKQPRLSILTKSALVLRDLDLLKQFKSLEVGVTITTLDEQARQRFEPGASSVSERIGVLEQLKSQNISSYAFIRPILPHITDVEQIFTRLKHLAGEFWLENLNLKNTNWDNVSRVLKQFYPSLHHQYEEMMYNNGAYWASYKKYVEKLIQEQEVKARIYFH